MNLGGLKDIHRPSISDELCIIIALSLKAINL